MKCSYCGTENQEGMKYCGECGTWIMVPEPQFNPPVYSMYSPPRLHRVRTGYLIGGGLTAALFFGLFYWASNYTWDERVWHQIYADFGYYETVTHTVDPAIQALLLVVAIAGVIAMIYGIASRR